MGGWPLFQPPEAGFHAREFGRLPVLMDGRFQPFDSVARNSLLQIRTKQTVPLDNGQTLSASEWLLEVMMKPEQADARKIFRIDNGEVLALLKLPENQKFYSFSQLRPQADEIQKQADRIEPIDVRQAHGLRDTIDEAVRRDEPLSAARNQPQTARLG